MSPKTSVATKKILWGVSAGCISGHINFVKDALSLVSEVGFIHWEVLALIILAIFVAVLGLHLLNLAMRKYDVTCKNYSNVYFVSFA